MRPTTTTTAGLVAALLAVAAMQVPNAAIALNPQPEVPSKLNPKLHKKSQKSNKKPKHLPPGMNKR
jgi:hypothetical protein